MNKTILIGLVIVLASFASAELVETQTPIVLAEYNENVNILKAYVKNANNDIFDMTQLPSGPNNKFNFTLDESLRNQNYTFVINASDDLDNDEVYTFDFEIRVPFFIILKEPKFGYTNNSPYDIEIETSELARCAWSQRREGNILVGQWFDNDKTPNSHSLMHTLVNKTWTGRTYYFKCVNLNNETITQGFEFNIDRSAPEITLTANPAKVIDPGERTSVLTIQSSDESVCWINDVLVDNLDIEKESSYKKEHTVDISFDVADTETHTFNYTVKCQNKAGESGVKNTTIVVELTHAFDIEVLSPDSDFTNQDPVSLKLGTLISTDCQYFMNGWQDFQSSDFKTHTASLSNLEEKKHQVLVVCSSSMNDVNKTIEFTVDKTKPVNVSIEPDQEDCSIEILGAIFKAEDSSGIKHFNYSIRNKTGLFLGWRATTSTSIQHKKLDLIPGEQYTWQMTVTDLAGNEVDSEPLNVIPKDSSFEECDFFKPFIELTSEEATGGERISVECKTDSTIGCESLYNYSIIALGETCGKSDLQASLSESQFVPHGSRFCVWATAKNGLNAFRQKAVKTPPGSGNDGNNQGNNQGQDPNEPEIPTLGRGSDDGYCGDGSIDAGEECDGSNLGTFSTCEDIGREGRSLSCTSTCRYDTSQCTKSPDVDEPLAPKRNMFGVIMAFLGFLLMMGGSGYLVYKNYFVKQEFIPVKEVPKQPEQRPSIAPKKAPPGPLPKPKPQKPQLSVEKIREMERTKILKEEEKKMKKAQREKLFDEFDKKDEKKK